MTAPFPHRHLLGIEGLSASDILTILDAAEPWIAFNRGARKADDRLAGLTQINAFFENSTRTLFSFEIAGKRLGAQVSNFHPAASSVRKGESLIDTALTLNAMRPDILVIRHEADGAAAEVAAADGLPGDQRRRRPRRASDPGAARRADDPAAARPDRGLDGRDLRRHPPQPRRQFEHARAAPARRRGARWSGPPALLPGRLPACPCFTDLDEGIAGADVVMMLRIQRERMARGGGRIARRFPRASTA